MSEISDLESRISAAMDRISRGLEALPTTVEADTSEDAEALEAARAELENEKLASAQLEERIKTLNGKLEEVETALADANDAVEKAADARDAAEEQLHEAKAAHEAAMADAKAAHEAALEAAAEQAAAEAEALAPAAEVIDLDQQRDSIGQLANRLRRLRQTSRQVRGSNQQLRAAVKGNLPDASLVNQGLEAELESLKAMRAAELAEMDVIMAALRPMLGQDVPAAEDEKEDT